MNTKDLMAVIEKSIFVAEDIDGYDNCDDSKIRTIQNNLKTIREAVKGLVEKVVCEEVIISVTDRSDGSTDLFKVTKEQWCAIAKIVDYYGFSAEYNFEVISDIQRLC